MSDNQEKEKKKLDKSLEKNHAYLLQRLDIETNFDIGVRKYRVGNRYIYAYYVNSLTDGTMMSNILRQISLIGRPLSSFGAFQALFDEGLNNMQVEVTDDMDELVDQLLSGLLIVLGDTWGKGFIIDVREYPGRQPEEPDTERVVRGSRDGFTENIIFNSGLVRRRIRDERLRMEMTQVGERSKTDICISYINDIADPGLVNQIKEQLEKIEVDGIPMAEKAIEEFMINQGYNPFPKARFTERPDVAAAHLYEGHVILFVDTSPGVIILPTTYFHHVQHAEEFRQTPFIGIYVRWIRFFGIAFAMVLLPLWMLFVMQPELLPEQLKFIGPEERDYPIPIVLQFLIAEFGIDLMRMAAVHTPTPLATAMGLIAAVLIGEIAIQVGIFTHEVILYLAVAAIGTFATPSYELGLANKAFRMLLIIITYFFGVSGFMLAITIFIICLANMKSLRTPYLWPLIPFNLKAFSTIVLRFTSKMNKTRPSIVHPQNKQKQPETGKS